jgi:hypothetical protein
MVAQPRSRDPTISQDLARASLQSSVQAASGDRPSLVNEEVVYNVAIGSNMSEAKLRVRGSSSRTRITPLLPPVPCTVPDWQLSFDLLAFPPTEPAMAGARRRAPGDNDVMHGILYKLSRYDYETLALSEGCSNSTSLYTEAVVDASPYADSTAAGHYPQTVKATVFALRFPPDIPLGPRHIFPSKRYMDMVTAGAKEVGLHQSVTKSLEALPTARAVSPRMKGFSRFSVIGMFFLFKSNRIMLLVRHYYKPVLAALFAWREEAFYHGRTGLSLWWTVLMVLLMTPAAVLGVVRAAFQRRNVFKIARGEPEE